MTAARVVGVPDSGIIFQHLLPNILGPLSVAATFYTAQAILLEALGDPLQSSGRSAPDQLAVLADTLAIAWQPASVDRVPDAADKAIGLAGLITEHWERLERPCPVAVRDQALRYAEMLAHAPADSLVVVHGDPHPGNALLVPRRRAGAETGFCFVDPDGFVADRAYDLGVTMRDFSSGVLREGRPVVESYAELLADRTGPWPSAGLTWNGCRPVCTSSASVRRRSGDRS